MKETSIYIHIPFCDHKCIYCDFYSIITYDNIEPYLTSLLREIDFFADKFSNERIIKSIYFGGGTPSFVEPDYIQKIISKIKNKFSVSNTAEITLETNPGTVDQNKLREFYKAGINRLSIGIQSFNKNELEFLTRIHDEETAIKTVEDASNAGFKNISIDLIFNLPGQTKEKWLSNLAKAVKLPVNHISSYSLILEKGTILNKMVLDGKVKMQDPDYDAELYESTIYFLEENGFLQYEVSNFTQRGFECIHNLAYWRYEEYMSFGTSAHSFVNGKRWWNYSSLKFYIESVKAKGNAVINEEILSPEEMLEEYVMLTLRSSGLDKKDLTNRFGDSWLNKNYDYIMTLIRENLLIEKDNLLKFTPRGYSICDEILTKFD